MATIIVKILTDVRLKRSRSNDTFYQCTGLTTESELCTITAWSPDQKEHLIAGNTVIIRKCNVTKRDTRTFVQLNKEATVSIAVF